MVVFFILIYFENSWSSKECQVIHEYHAVVGKLPTVFKIYSQKFQRVADRKVLVTDNLLVVGSNNSAQRAQHFHHKVTSPSIKAVE